MAVTKDDIKANYSRNVLQTLANIIDQVCELYRIMQWDRTRYRRFVCGVSTMLTLPKRVEVTKKVDVRIIIVLYLSVDGLKLIWNVSWI